MLVLMTASYIDVSMKIWIHALYATHAGIRSLEMIQATLRGCVSRRGCLPTKKMEGRQVVTEVDAEGCPSAPEAASTKFVNQCVVIVRARIPITTRLWKTSKPEE